MRTHSVQFFSPGTMVSETTTKPIDQWDTHLAADIARSIEERHGAKPYGFQFVTSLIADDVPDGEGGTLKVAPKEVERSGTHYITGELLLFDDIPETTDKRILKSNMRCNSYPVCVENHNSYRFTNFFEERDCIVDKEGNVIRRGTDADLVAYRASKIAAWKEST